MNSKEYAMRWLFFYICFIVVAVLHCRHWSVQATLSGSPSTQDESEGLGGHWRWCCLHRTRKDKATEHDWRWESGGWWTSLGAYANLWYRGLHSVYSRLVHDLHHQKEASGSDRWPLRLSYWWNAIVAPWCPGENRQELGRRKVSWVTTGWDEESHSSLILFLSERIDILPPSRTSTSPRTFTSLTPTTLPTPCKSTWHDHLVSKTPQQQRPLNLQRRECMNRTTCLCGTTICSRLVSKTSMLALVGSCDWSTALSIKQVSSKDSKGSGLKY